MPSNGAVKGNKRLTSGSSEFNAMEFLIRNTILGLVNTAIPVIVTAVDAGGAGAATGYVTVKPLVCQVDGFGETLDPAELFRVPYARVQGGIAALVIDPVVGDVGLAVFAKSDCSNVAQMQSKPVQPGSFRKFSMSDGFYFGGFLNRAPSVYIEADQTNIVIHAVSDVTIQAPSKVRIESPLIEVTGQIVQTGEQSSAGSSFLNGFTNTGGSITSNGVVLETHVHPGDSGGVTGPPNT